jgi:hypothetical protein
MAVGTRLYFSLGDFSVLRHCSSTAHLAQPVCWDHTAQYSQTPVQGSAAMAGRAPRRQLAASPPAVAGRMVSFVAKDGAFAFTHYHGAYALAGVLDLTEW